MFWFPFTRLPCIIYPFAIILTWVQLFGVWCKLLSTIRSIAYCVFYPQFAPDIKRNIQMSLFFKTFPSVRNLISFDKIKSSPYIWRRKTVTSCTIFHQITVKLCDFRIFKFFRHKIFRNTIVNILFRVEKR